MGFNSAFKGVKNVVLNQFGASAKHNNKFPDDVS